MKDSPSFHIKPSLRITLRKMTLNFRLIGGLILLLSQFLDVFLAAFTSEDSITTFLYQLADSTSVIIVIVTVLSFLLFIFLIFLIVTNIGAIIWGYLNYLTMDNYIDDQTVNIKKGVIFKKYNEIPIHKLTDIQINISILDRILKTADVHCNTAGGKTLYVLQTLHQEDAYKIQSFLLTRIASIDVYLNTIPEHFLSDPRIISELNEIRELIPQAFKK